MSHQKFLLSLAVLLMAIIVTACGPAAASTLEAESNIPQITIKATDFAFEAPAQIEAGLVSIKLENAGQEPHHVQLARLNDGVTQEQFQDMLQQGPEAAFPLVTWAGGVGLLGTNASQEVTVELTPGQYVLLCFMAGHDGVPHLAKGMLKPIEVVAAAEQVETPEIKADASIKLLDFSFAMPAEIKAGEQVWQIVNQGEQVHELALIKLAEGKTMADVGAFMEAPHGVPPFEFAGGLQAVDPGETGWVTLDLLPGNYVAMCHVPDPATGHAHFEMGMVTPFSVK